MMGYTEALKDLLRPLGIYRLDAGISEAEMYAAGKVLDKIDGLLAELEAECTVSTAESYGLENYEAILPARPVYGSIEDRRKAVEALLKIDEASLTLSDMNAALAGCGLSAEAEETGSTKTIRVVFPENRGDIEGLEDIKGRVEAILPCHLEAEYIFAYLLWRELEREFETWEDMETCFASWKELEKWEPEI